jgi:hypothetical protein
MSSAPDDLDNPLYGEFEDYLDGKLPPARRQEVAEFLARSAAAREALEELQMARKWLEGTQWDVPEPTEWPSARAILARAGWHPATSPSAAKSDQSAGESAWWLAGWMPWRWNVRSPAWAFGAAACALLLVGGSLWWALGPSAPDEMAQSRVSEDSELPARPKQPGSAPAQPEDTAPSVWPGEAALVDATSQKKEPSAPEAGSPERKSKGLGPPAGSTDAMEGAQESKVSSAPLPLAAPAGEQAEQASAVGAPLAGDEVAHEVEAMTAEQRKSHPSATSPSPEMGATPHVAGRLSGARTAERSRANRNRDEMKEPSEAQPGSADDAQEVAASVRAATLRLVVADRGIALAQVVTVAREFGGSVRLNGEHVTVTVPAGQVSACADRLRARVSIATEGETLQVTIRARE